MEHFTLSEQQISALSDAQEPVAVHDEKGQVRGYVAMIVTQGELADARRALAAKQPRYTTVQVLAALQAKHTS